MHQQLLVAKWKSLLQKLYNRPDDHGYVPFVIVTIPSIFHNKISYQWIFNKSGTIHTTIGAGTAYHSGTPKFTPGYQWCSCCSIFSFLCLLYQPLLFCLCLFVLADNVFGIFKLFLSLVSLIRQKNKVESKLNDYPFELP